MPDDHWVWKLSSQERSAEVKRALDFYKRFGQEIEAIRAATEEIKSVLAQGSIMVENKQPEKDDRLFDALDKFLDF